MASPAVFDNKLMWLFAEGYDAYRITDAKPSNNTVTKINDIYLERLRDKCKSQKEYNAALTEAVKDNKLFITYVEPGKARLKPKIFRPELAAYENKKMNLTIYVLHESEKYNIHHHVQCEALKKEVFSKRYHGVKTELQKQPRSEGCCTIQ